MVRFWLYYTYYKVSETIEDNPRGPASLLNQIQNGRYKRDSFGGGLCVLNEDGMAPSLIGPDSRQIAAIYLEPGDKSQYIDQDTETIFAMS